MADIKKYGDLDDKELLEFLAEIKSGDEDIEEAKINADEKIGNEEKEKDITSGEQLALASFYGSATLVSLISAEVLTDTLLDTEKKS